MAVVLHWVVAALVLAQATWGWTMQAIAKGQGGVRADAFNLHKSVGLVILALMLVRLGWRLAHRPPPLLGLPAWQRRLAVGTHALLYAALLAMPLTGYLGSVWSGYPVKWFGITLPAWGTRSPGLKDLMSTLHLGISTVLIAAIVLHVAGAVRHILAHDGYAARMGLRRALPGAADLLRAAGERARERPGLET